MNKDEKVKYVSLDCLEKEELQRFENLIKMYSKSVLAFNLIMEERDHEQLKERIDKVTEIVENCSRNEYYYKYNNRYLKSEIIEQLKEALNYE